MAVISELIDVGLQLKSQDKHEAAIEHFRQLHETYPDSARIKFELAATWGAFGVPEQALPLYRELLALPKRQGLPAKDLPRLYARAAAALYAMHEYDQALNIAEEGLRLHPSYRPLRAFRIFNLYAAGKSGAALLDALDLMLESLAPSRWDIFEDDVKGIVSQLAQSLADDDKRPDGIVPAAIEVASVDDAQPDDDAAATVVAAATVPKTQPGDQDNSNEVAGARNRIDVSSAPDENEDFELEVKIKSSAKKRDKSQNNTRKSKRQKDRKVRINISGSEDSGEVDVESDDDADAAGSAKLTIPIDFD